MHLTFHGVSFRTECGPFTPHRITTLAYPCTALSLCQALHRHHGHGCLHHCGVSTHSSGHLVQGTRSTRAPGACNQIPFGSGEGRAVQTRCLQPHQQTPSPAGLPKTFGACPPLLQVPRALLRVLGAWWEAPLPTPAGRRPRSPLRARQTANRAWNLHGYKLNTTHRRISSEGLARLPSRDPINGEIKGPENPRSSANRCPIKIKYMVIKGTERYI